LLTLDVRSLPALAGEDRERAEFLCELCLTPAVDGLWTWGSEPLDVGLPQAELRPLNETLDARAIGLLTDPQGFIGVVASWSSHERLADEIYELTGAARDWFIYYSTTTKFHSNAKRHFFVTSDRALISESRSGRRQQYWQQRHVVSVAGAIRLAGRVMLAREAIYDEARANYRHHTSPYTFYFYLSPELAPSRIRLHRWVETQTSDDRRKLEALEQSMHDRVVDLLKARDRISVTNARHQTNATLDEMLYHLRSAIGGAAALFDSTAVFAQLAVKIDEVDAGAAARVSLRNQSFRRLLRKHGAGRLAQAAGELMPMLDLTWSLRTPIVHREGLGGSNYVNLQGSGGNGVARAALHGPSGCT
jgi:hypothetical protein